MILYIYISLYLYHLYSSISPSYHLFIPISISVFILFQLETLPYVGQSGISAAFVNPYGEFWLDLSDDETDKSSVFHCYLEGDDQASTMSSCLVFQFPFFSSLCQVERREEICNSNWMEMVMVWKYTYNEFQLLPSRTYLFCFELIISSPCFCCFWPVRETDKSTLLPNFHNAMLTSQLLVGLLIQKEWQLEIK